MRHHAISGDHLLKDLETMRAMLLVIEEKIVVGQNVDEKHLAALNRIREELKQIYREMP